MNGVGYERPPYGVSQRWRPLTTSLPSPMLTFVCEAVVSFPSVMQLLQIGLRQFGNKLILVAEPYRGSTD